MSDGVGYPILLMDVYGKAGRLFVGHSDNQRHLYEFPDRVNARLKDVIMKGFPVRLDGPSQVALFAYDNDTLVVESYRPDALKVKVSALGTAKDLRDLSTGDVIEPLKDTQKRSRWEPPAEERTAFEVEIDPHSFRGFKIER